MEKPTTTAGHSSVKQKERGSAEYLEMIKKVANEFSHRERTFFLYLSVKDQKLMDDGSKLPTWYHAARARHHVQIMLTLKEVKPCTMIVHPYVYGKYQSVMNKMTKDCLAPLMSKYNLKEYGFVLQQITHPMPTEKGPGFQGAWIFADMRSAKWPDVNNIFLIPHPGQKADEREMGKALGYPINRCINWKNTMALKDHTEKELLKAIVKSEKKRGKVCCVTGLEYFVGECPADKMLEEMLIMYKHAERCTEAAKAVGWELILDTSRYRAVHEFEKKASALGEASGLPLPKISGSQLPPDVQRHFESLIPSAGES